MDFKNLSRNQKIVISVVALLVLGGVVFLYQNVAEESASYGVRCEPGTKCTSDSPQEPVPESVDDITDAIINETMADQAALDQEAAGEGAQIQEETQAVNDLGNAYDEESY